MHYLHLVVVNAESPSEAYDKVEKLIDECEESSKGDWWVVCGSVSSDNEVDIRNEEGRWAPARKETVASVNETVQKWFKLETGEQEGLRLLKRHVNGKG